MMIKIVIGIYFTICASATAATVRMGYVIPFGRTAQPNGVESFTKAMERCRDYLENQLELHGFPGRTLALETIPGTNTPKIHIINSSKPDTEFVEEGFLSESVEAAEAQGFTPNSPGEVWVFVPEAHSMNADGSIVTQLGGGEPLGNSLGEEAHSSFVSGAALARLKHDSTNGIDFLTDNRHYDGLTIDEIGPHPLVRFNPNSGLDGFSFANIAGYTISSIASESLGEMLHELLHSLGLPHDFRNDRPWHGNLMGNGHRGIRGTLFPSQFTGFPYSYTSISYGSALILRNSPFLGAPTQDSELPSVDVVDHQIVDGILSIEFEASDDTELSCATLLTRSHSTLVGELDLTGHTASTFDIITTHFDANITNKYYLNIRDSSNNWTRVEVDAFVGPVDKAPTANIRASRNVAPANSIVIVGAGHGEDIATWGSVTLPPIEFGSIDREDGTNLTYEWDLNGDGNFVVIGSPATPGAMFFLTSTRAVRVKVTDSAGQSTISPPLVIEAQ